MPATTAKEKIQLNDSERALVRRLPAKTAYVGIVQFRGPRGRNYIPIRTAACVTLDQALTGIERIRGKQYRSNAFPTTDEVYAVDQLGNVIG